MRDEALESLLHLLHSGSGNKPIRRLLKLAQTVSSSLAAGLFLSRDCKQEIVVGDGIPYTFYKFPLPDRLTIPVLFKEPLQISELTADPVGSDYEYAAFREHWSWMAGVPVPLLHTPSQLALVALDWRDDVKRDPNFLSILKHLAAVIADELRLIGQIAVQQNHHGDLLLDADCIREAVSGFHVPIMLINAKLKIEAISGPMSDILSIDKQADKGTPILQYFADQRSSIEDFFLERLRSHGGEQSCRVSPMGVRPPLVLRAVHCSEVGSGQKMMIVTATIGQANGSVMDVAQTNGSASLTHAEPAAVTSDFLLDTLVTQRRVRRRGTTDFHTLTRWRSPIKDAQIAALRSIKRSVPSMLLNRVATDLAHAATSLFGRKTIQGVCAVPCGHSGPGCLSEQLGRAAADILRLPFISAFEPLPVSGSSHPKANSRRPAMKVTVPVDKPVLLIDDVATSGAHIDEAARKLKKHAPAVLPIVWIGD